MPSLVRGEHDLGLQQGGSLHVGLNDLIKTC